MSVFEMAKKYYPRLWDAERIERLAEAGKLSEEEKRKILEGDDEP